MLSEFPEQYVAEPVFDLPQEEQGIDGTFTVFPNESSPAIASTIADHRATKYNFALSENSPGKDSIRMALEAGSEKNLRLKAISDEALRNQRIREAIAGDIIRGKRGLALDDNELETLKELAGRDLELALTDPDVIMEKMYGKKVMDVANSLTMAGAYAAYVGENPDNADAVNELGADLIAKKELVQRELEDVRTRWQGASWASTVSNYGELLVPFFSWWNYQNAIKGSKGNRFLPGNNIEDQIRHYYSLPVNEARVALREAVAEMEASNPIDAMMFLSSLMNYSQTGRTFDNLVGVLDIASVTPIVTVAKLTGKGIHALEFTKDISKIASKPGVKAEEILEAAGERTLTAQEYFTKTVQAVQERAANQGQQATWDDMFGRLPLLSNPKAFLEGGELAKSAPFLQKVEQELLATSARMIDGVLVEPLTIHRVQPGTAAFDALVEEAVERVAKTIPVDKAVEHIIYASPGNPKIVGALQDTTLSGTNELYLHLGQRGGVPYEREIEAQWRINMWGLKDATVVPEGNGYAIQVRTTGNEANPKYRAAIPTDAPTPKDYKNMFLSWARTPNELLSADVVSDRAVATYGISKMTEMAQNMLREVKAGMSKKDWQRFDEFVTYQRDFKRPNSDVPGKFSKDLGEFEMEWQSKFGVLPSEAEAIAYLRYKQINDMDYAVRALLTHKNLASLGVEHIRLPRGGSWDDFQNGPAIQGRIVTEDPFLSDEGFSFLIWHHDPEMLKSPYHWFPNSGKIAGKGEVLKDRIAKEGLVPVALTEDGEAMLRANPHYARVLPDTSIDYIYVKRPRREPLPINSLPYQPGGHRQTKEGFYISQPIIESRTRVTGAEVNFYKGDIHFAHFTRESDARNILGHIEEARQLYVKALAGNKDLTPVSRYLQDNLPGLMSIEDFAKMFSGKKGQFNPNTPLSVRPSNRTVNDVENLSTRYPNLRVGGPDNVHKISAQRLDPAFIKERGSIFPTIANTGSDIAPKFSFAPAEMISPIETMESAFQNIIKSKYLDDLRIKVTERFVNEFANILDTPLEQLRANPWAHMLEPQYKKGADPRVKQAAENLRRTTLEFMNIRTPLEKEIAYVKQKLADSIYQKVGKDGMAKLERGRELLDDRTLGATKDPIRFLRSLAFHEKLGLFNVKQLFLQAQNLTTILSVEGPARGMKAGSAYMFHRAMMINSNPEVVDKLASIAARFGWSKKELMESWEAGNRSGFFRVGGEVAYHDLGATPSINQTTFGRMLDNAAFFFREGERISRITAWNAAYLRWKAMNPNRVLTDVDIAAILNRADDLNGNMSRASNAMWQQGIFSIPTQFWGYQARITELMLGRRLDGAEKARLIAGYSLMYGLPTGFAIGTGAGMLWPWHEATRKYMIENGMAYDDNALSRIAQEGFGGIVSGLIFGEPTDYSQSYSPQGLNVVKDLLDPKKGIFTVLGGVSSTVLVDNIKATQPFGMALLKAAGYDGGYDLTPRDFSDAFQHIASFSNLSKALVAYQTQEYWSKKEAKLKAGEVSAVKALMIAATGLVPKEINDAYAMAASLQDRKAANEEIRNEIIKNLRIGFKSDTPADADKYFRRVNILINSGQFTPREVTQIYNQAAKGYESMVDNIARRYAETSPERMKDYLRKGTRD